jgi:ATP-binding cassette subfamily F protein uup
MLDEPTNDLDIPALEVLEESLAEFPGALVVVSHDRDLLDRICTEVVGLDGRGGAALYASVGQWLAAYERAIEEKEKPVAPPRPAPPPKPAPPKPRKLSNREQQELDGMEAAILAAEQEVARREAAVAEAAASHSALSEACRAFAEAQQTVERLYARWHDLEERRGS